VGSGEAAGRIQNCCLRKGKRWTDGFAFHGETMHEEIFKLLVSQGGADGESKDKWGWMPLRLVAMNGHLDALKFLVKEAGANVELKDSPSIFSPGGRTLLSCAAEAGHLEVVKWLVEEGGADVESKDKWGKTALDLARQGMKESWKQEGCKAMVAWVENRRAQIVDRGLD